MEDLDAGSEAVSKSALWVWQTLWRPEQQTKITLNIADAVLFKRGAIDKWIFTSKKGEVLKKSAESTVRKQIHARFVHLARNDANARQCVAEVHNLDGSSQVLDKSAWDTFMKNASFLNVSSIQSFIMPKGGYGSSFRTTYKLQADGVTAICITHRTMSEGDEGYVFAIHWVEKG